MSSPPRSRPAAKQRLDILLVQRGHFESRQRAQAAIFAGQVFVEGELSDKPGAVVALDARVEVRGPKHPFVSRGGVKLAAALDAFAIDVSDIIAVDIGASTGGFTDCLLARGARRVYAVDVGRRQLHPRLQADPRVIALDGCNARNLRPQDIGEPVDLVTIDVSFISLTKILPAAVCLLKPHNLGVVGLIKPQFELGPKQAKRGVVRDPEMHRLAITNVLARAQDIGLPCVAIAPSPIRGPEGNVEFFAHWVSSETIEKPPVSRELITAAVVAAHAQKYSDGRNHRTSH